MHTILYKNLLEPFYQQSSSVFLHGSLGLFGLQSVFSTCKFLRNLKLQLNTERRIIRPCQVWFRQLRVHYGIDPNLPTPSYWTHVPGVVGHVLVGANEHGQIWHSLFHIVRSSPANIVTYVRPSDHLSNIPVAERRPSVFVTEFEYCDDPVFLGRIGILGRPCRGFSYVPWCPSYPTDLWESSESSEHDGSLSWSDGEPSDLDEGELTSK